MNQKPMKINLSLKLIIAVSIIISLSLFVVFYFFQNLHQKSLEDQVIEKARALSTQLTFSRQWFSVHENVYVKKAPGTDIDKELERFSIKDESGNIYIIKNHALFTKEISVIAEENSDFTFRIFSDNPLNSENLPQNIEYEALEYFKKGSVEFIKKTKLNEINYLYFIAPFSVNNSCLTCHKNKEYKIGDILGGISIIIPINKSIEIIQKNNLFIIFAVLFLNIIILSLIYFIFSNLITKPLSKIKYAAEQVSSGNLDVTIDLNTQDELQILSDTFNKMIKGLKTSHEFLEKEISIATDELTIEKSRIEGIIKGIAEGVYTTDTNLIIRTWNPAAKFITGYEEIDVIGKKCSDVIKHLDSSGQNLCKEFCPSKKCLGNLEKIENSHRRPF